MKKTAVQTICADILCGAAAGLLTLLQNASAFGDDTMISCLITIPLLLCICALLLRQKKRGHRILRTISALLCFSAAFYLNHYALYETMYDLMHRGGGELSAGDGVALVFVFPAAAWILILIAARIAVRLSRPRKAAA